MSDVAASSVGSIDCMAEEIFCLTVLAWRERLSARHHGEAADLSESQFLTLDSLVNGQTKTVGELQRSIGVLPAQMSRIIRSLESGFDKPLIRCELNQQDKRKIDVTLTNAGLRVYNEFRTARIAKNVEVLGNLPEHDRAEFVRICRDIKVLYQDGLRRTAEQLS